MIPGDAVEGAELLRFARSISTSPSLDELKQRFLVGFGRVVRVPMYGYALVDPVTDSPTCVANGNVSATFVARYERDAKHMDPLLKRAYRTGLTTYNLALMTAGGVGGVPGLPARVQHAQHAPRGGDPRAHRRHDRRERRTSRRPSRTGTSA